MQKYAADSSFHATLASPAGCWGQVMSENAHFNGPIHFQVPVEFMLAILSSCYLNVAYLKYYVYVLLLLLPRAAWFVGLYVSAASAASEGRAKR